MSLQSVDTATADGRWPTVPWRRGFGVGVVVWFVGFTLAFLATPLVGGPIPIAEAPVSGPVLTYLGFHLWFVLSTGGFVLAYGPGLVYATVAAAVMLAGGTAAAGRRGRGVVAGASIAVGYFLTTVAAVTLVWVLAATGLSGVPLAFGPGPGTWMVVLVDGLVQPAILGAVGGLLTRRTR